MKPLDDNQFGQALQRGKLTPEQELELQAYLALNPDERADVEEEVNLSHCLRQVPNAPLSSNFTARVLAEAQRQHARRGWSLPALPGLRSLAAPWLPRLVTFGAVLGLSLIAFHQHQMAVARKELARQLVTVSQLAPPPSLELLENFEAIRQLGQLPAEDDRKLIAALR